MSVAAFRLRFPDFVDDVQFSDDLIGLVLSEADNSVDSVCFGSQTTIARQYYAAHLLAYVTGGARAKGASSVAAGSANISWDTAKINFGATAYGQHYQFLARSECGGGRVLC